MTNCNICKRLKQFASDPALVYEFPNSVLLLGNHQYFQGYCILLYKRHVRELHELDSDTQAALNRELMISTASVAETVKPWKMNHACLGNQDQHIHWHIIPRHESEADRHCNPWKHADEFERWIISEPQQRELAAKIRQHIVQYLERILK